MSVPVDTSIVTLIISAPSQLLVNEARLLGVVGKKASGELVPLPDATWSSSDSSVAVFTSTGVLRGRALGTATITARRGSLTSAVTIRINAKLRVAPFMWPEGARAPVQMGFGDTLQMVAHYVDVDGVPIVDQPQVSWTTSRPDLIAVDQSGQVLTSTGGTFACPCDAAVIASVSDTSIATFISVVDARAGQSATLRLVHAVNGVGPVTFVRNHGAPVTLSFGESIDLTVGGGQVIMRGQGLPGTMYKYFHDFLGIVKGGESLTVYAVGNTQESFLTPAWSDSSAIPPDSGRVRLVEGYNLGGGVVSLVQVGAPPKTLPDLCYFDPGTASDYFRRPAGEFDIVVQAKYGGAGPSRLRANAEPGAALTYVLVGDAPNMRVLKFRDR